MYDVRVGGYLIRYFSTVSACFRMLASTFLSFESGCFFLPSISPRSPSSLAQGETTPFVSGLRFQIILSIKLRYRAQIIELYSRRELYNTDDFQPQRSP